MCEHAKTRRSKTVNEPFLHIDVLKYAFCAASGLVFTWRESFGQNRRIEDAVFL